MAEQEASPPATYQLLVCGTDGRYHAVWSEDIAAATGRGWEVLPVAVCGQAECEPYDQSCMLPPVSCENCFPWLREYAPDAECVGAPRRDLTECGRQASHG